MMHEALPRQEHREVKERFFRAVTPEIRPIAHNALSNMLEVGQLRQSSATRLLQDFWATDEMRQARIDWQRDNDTP